MKLGGYLHLPRNAALIRPLRIRVANADNSGEGGDTTSMAIEVPWRSKINSVYMKNSPFIAAQLQEGAITCVGVRRDFSPANHARPHQASFVGSLSNQI